MSACAALTFVALLTPNSMVRAQTTEHSSAGSNVATSPVSPDFWSNRGRWAFGTQVGFSEENNIPHNISHIGILMVQPSIAFTLLNLHTPEFPVSRFSIVSEGILGGSVHPGGHVLGHAILFRLDGKPKGRVVPFFNAGAGVLHTAIDQHAPELSGSTQFNPQGGLGIQYFFSPQRAFVLEYRYMHMSNNGIQEPNHGFNSSMITIGFRWLRRPRPLAIDQTFLHRGSEKSHEASE